MIYLGIDPGLTGAVALNDYGDVQVFDLPTVEVGRGVVKRELDAAGIIGMLRNARIRSHLTDDEGCFAVLERTASMPGQGVASMFSMGVTRGIILCALAAAEVPYVEVVPSVWKRHFGLLGAEKDQSRRIALQRFPKLAPQLARIKDHNRAEALLLAEYGTTKGLGK